MKVGDPAEIEWSLRNTPDDWTQWHHAISGNRILVRDEKWQPSDQKDRQHPRTAIGINQAGNRMLLVNIDGRSPHSVGMNTHDLGRYLHHLGAHSALNFDGGGSSAMSVLHNGKAQLLNRPSDKKERSVPTGLGVFLDLNDLE